MNHTPVTSIPRRMFNLPRDPRGAPVPWFAGRDAEGHLRVTLLDLAKWRNAVKNRRCWMCGAPLGRYNTFVLGPVQAITRTVTEPPSHRGCAEYAVRVCPFLSNPARGRFDGVANQSGAPVNPGCSLCGNVLGDPIRVAWWTRGRPATKAEVEASQAVARRYCSDEN